MHFEKQEFALKFRTFFYICNNRFVIILQHCVYYNGVIGRKIAKQIDGGLKSFEIYQGWKEGLSSLPHTPFFMNRLSKSSVKIKFQLRHI